MFTSAALAKVYQPAGFAVAIEGGIDIEAITDRLAAAGLADRVVGILLHPSLEVALARNRERDTKSFDTSILEGVMREIDADLAAQAIRSDWHRIDNGGESVDETVERILPFAQ